MSIDSYIRSEPASVQKSLKALRALIRDAAPQASEKIAWGMPTFYLEGNLIHFAAFKNHYSLFPGGDVTRHFKKDLDRLGLVHSKGTIQFLHGTRLPVPLVKRIVKFCVKRNLSEAAQKKSGKKTGTRLKQPKRARNPMPAFVRSALLQTGLMEAYHSRPPYQQNDYVGWIGGAARDETRQKRLAQMLRELRAGNRYMNMAYRGSRGERS
jgi:uncharacterized protein YdhG (YjbR/CyaY superfamily)